MSRNCGYIDVVRVPPHREVPVKVNAFVDEEVAPIVTALSQFERVETVDSCQGYGDAPAYVYFRFRGTAEEFLAFLQGLSTGLGERTASCCDYRLRAEWLAGAKEPMGQLLVRRDYVPTLANALTQEAARRKGRATSSKICPECGSAAYFATPRCPCGYEWDMSP